MKKSDSYKDRVLALVVQGYDYAEAAKLIFREMQTLREEVREIHLMPHPHTACYSVPRMGS